MNHTRKLAHLYHPIVCYKCKGRNHCLQNFDHARTELSDWRHQILCSICNRNLSQKDRINLIFFTDHSFSQAAPQCGTIYHSMSSQTFPI